MADAGQASLLQDVRGPRKPALVLRVDVANVYGPNPPDELFCSLMDGGVETALRLDAACVVAFLLWIPGETDLHRQCVENLCRLKPECDRWGHAADGRPIAMKPDGKGGLAVGRRPERIATLVRQAVELGADVIKADPTDDLDDYARVLLRRGRQAGAGARRRQGQRGGDLRPHRARDPRRRGRHRLRTQRDPAREAERDHARFMAIVHDGAAADAMKILRDGLTRHRLNFAKSGLRFSSNALRPSSPSGCRSTSRAR